MQLSSMPHWYNHMFLFTEVANLKILNAGAWARRSDRVHVSLPPELEDFIPEAEEFYKKGHNGRKLQWHHLMSNGVVSRNAYWATGGYCWYFTDPIHSYHTGLSTFFLPNPHIFNCSPQHCYQCAKEFSKEKFK